MAWPRILNKEVRAKYLVTAKSNRAHRVKSYLKHTIIASLNVVYIHEIIIFSQLAAGTVANFSYSLRIEVYLVHLKVFCLFV